jgi:hypothetical protein
VLRVLLMNALFLFVAIALRAAGPDPIGFLTFVLLAIWFLRDQFGHLFKR